MIGFLDDVGPVGFDFGPHVFPAADIIHDVEFAAGGGSGLQDGGEQGVAVGAFGAVGVEALEGGGVAAVLLHPEELAVDGLLVVGGEERGRLRCV